MARDMTVPEARLFFAAQHVEQTDKQGRDYYEHHLLPISRALAGLGPEMEIAGLGHDWIEDVWIPSLPEESEGPDIEGAKALLRAAHVPARSIEAIVAVTRLPGETYDDLITKVGQSPDGTEVKLADNRHNLSSLPGLAAMDTSPAHMLMVNNRTKRYLNARDRLLGFRFRHMYARTLWGIYLNSCVCHLDDGSRCTCEAHLDAQMALMEMFGPGWHEICRVRYSKIA